MNRISIIGGGIGGLTTALCFQKLGINYKLYEQANEIKTVGAGIWLSPNALQVFEWISPQLLWDIQNSGNTFNSILIANHKLKPISHSNQYFVKQKFGYSTLAIHRGVLQKIIYSYLNKENIFLGKAFKNYSKNEDDSYAINFQDGSIITTQYILGANGINSNIRKQLFPNSKIRYSGQTCWRGVANFKLDSKHSSTGFTLWGKKLQFGVSYLGQGKTYWFAVKLSPANQKDDKNTLIANLVELFDEFDPIVKKLIQNTKVENIIRGDLSDLELLEKWYSENICLLGDAAHAMTPDLGQGGAQAAEDAFYLSNCIKNNDSIEIAFKQFYNYRKVKVEKLVKQSRNTSKIAITSKPIEIVRNFMLKYCPKAIMEKQMIELYTIDKTVADKTQTKKDQ